jgi:cytochrome c553
VKTIVLAALSICACLEVPPGIAAPVSTAAENAAVSKATGVCQDCHGPGATVSRPRFRVSTGNTPITSLRS